MSLKSRRELAASLAPHYRSASKTAKSQMLDGFVLSTGYNRKYAIGVLEKAGIAISKSLGVPRRRRRKYGADVEIALLSVWRLSGGLCAKRLVPFLRELIDALERFGEITLASATKIRLLEMSVSTAGRLLSRVRRQNDRGISTTLPGTLLRHQIPIRTYEDWSENRPGFMEIDLVAHCGGTAAGEYCYTLTMTDICTGWTECAGIVNRSQIAVVAAIEQIRSGLPFALLGIDSDNGSEFINHLLKRWCDDNNVTFTRCRPYKKNDQCHVEQKNGAVVRPLVGYARYEGAAACAHLNKLYQAHRLCLNFFEPSMKLIGKTRNGARVKKSYDQAQTPWQRYEKILDQHEEGRAQLAAMRKKYLMLNPAQLRRNLRDLEMALPRFAVGQSFPDQPDDLGKRNVTFEGGARYAQNA